MNSLFTLRNGLIAAAVALVAALGFETEWGSALTASSTPTRSVTGKHDNAAVLPDFRLSSEATNYAQISERPLLNPTRKPAPTQLVVAATEPPKPQVRRGLYQLIGVMDLGTVKVAQVREIASNRTKSIREGDALQEMTVKKVDATQVTLAFQGETDVLELAKFTASGRVPQPVAPPPPPPQPVVQAQPFVPPPLPLSPVAVGAGQPVQPPFPQPIPVPTAAAPVAPQREVMNVVEMLERRRLARQQAGGQEDIEMKDRNKKMTARQLGGGLAIAMVAGLAGCANSPGSADRLVDRKSVV